jgi:riboflavin synthase alpha subunit
MGLSYAIDGIERTITNKGDETIKVKLADRQAALEFLGKYLKLIQQGQQVNVEVGTQKAYQFVVIQRMTPEEWDRYYEQKMQKIYGSPSPDKPKQ